MDNLKFLSTSRLKIIAMMSMLIDHVAAANLVTNNDTVYMMRLIGRLAFPIFAFLISEGYFHTKNKKNYLIRLGIFALISEIPFDLAFSGRILEFEHQNIFFTLWLGLIALILYDKNKQFGFLFLAFIGIVAELVHTDYGLYGILYIFSFYIFRGKFSLTALTVLILNSYYLIINLGFLTQFFSITSLVILYFYNHKKGHNFKYLFYGFYPLHLLVLFIIKLF